MKVPRSTTFSMQSMGVTARIKEAMTLRKMHHIQILKEQDLVSIRDLKTGKVIPFCCSPSQSHELSAYAAKNDSHPTKEDADFLV